MTLHLNPLGSLKKAKKNNVCETCNALPVADGEMETDTRYFDDVAVEIPEQN